MYRAQRQHPRQKYLCPKTWRNAQGMHQALGQGLYSLGLYLCQGRNFQMMKVQEVWQGVCLIDVQ